MAQNLDQPQMAYINGVVRPKIERIVQWLDEMDTFLLDANNQQKPIINNTEVLNDGADGTSPRLDAPQLTGQNVAQLVTFVTNMRAQVTTAQLNALTALMVRDVRTVLRDSK